MKNNIQLPMIIVLFFASFIIRCQSKVDTAKDLEEQITALDKSGWDAWKNKDGKWFVKIKDTLRQHGKVWVDESRR